jgi:hypothetical protein
LSETLSVDDLFSYCTLDDNDRELIQNTRSDGTRLSLTLLLKSFQQLGYFVPSISDIPDTIVVYVASQLSISPDLLNNYDDTHPVRRLRYRKMIRNHLGFTVYVPGKHGPRLRKALLNGPTDDAIRYQELIFNAVKLLQEWGVELPTQKVLYRLLTSALSESEKKTFHIISERISQEAKDKLNKLLLTDQPHIQSPFYWIKKSPGRPSLMTMQKEIEKLERLSELGVRFKHSKSVSSHKISHFARLTARYTNTEMARFTPEKRFALLAAFAIERIRDKIDYILEIFLKLMRKISSKSEENVNAEIVREFKKGNDHRRMLYDLAELLLKNPHGTVADVVFPKFPQKQLEELIENKEQRPASYHYRHKETMAKKFSYHYRRMLPLILENLTFHTSPAKTWLLDAIQFLKEMRPHTKYLDLNVPRDDLTQTWESYILRKTPAGDRVVRRYYELWIADQIAAGLRNGDVWVEGSRNYKNWDELLPQDWDERRIFYLNGRELP